MAEMVKRCEACQFHAKQIHQPAQELQTIPLTWPFAVWRLDILGPFPRAQGGYRYLYITIDKFTKWVEVELMCTILARSVVKFIRGLVCHFGVSNRIITNNGSQFTSRLFQEYCASADIKISFASVAYPRSNGQAERANAEVLKGLKTRSFNAKLKAYGKKWLDNLQSILWSIRTTTTKPTGETPFFWSMGRRLFFPPMSSLGRQECPPSTRYVKKTSSRITSSSSKKLGAKQCFAPQDTSKDYATTIAAMFGQGLWRSAI
jgi:transposase InsO family protein